MKKIFVTGIAGTGKSTIAAALNERGQRIIDIDHVPNLCSWVHNISKKKVLASNPSSEFMDEHSYECDVDLLQQLMEEGKSDIIVFGNVGDNTTLHDLFDKVILLQCDPDILIKRIKTRTTNDFGKNPGVQKRMLEWRMIFDDLMIARGALPIDSSQPLEKVVEEVETILRK